ncbi:MAG: dTDP-4-dehydrorhamnose 3,5-epimerase [Bacteroidales bacterium]|nr:dTDP-4-dehydrorhamnose 3,5-epimerase [Bacteroidales bacterium]MBN2758050.1 dTDP-4-dehydrorhamnose 3,5-epimerase [Bacteroidales bacterium]
MKITETFIDSLKIIEPRVFEDGRGYFFESYSKEKFEQNNIFCDFVQDNESFSTFGVIRGLHYQLEPYAQTKLLRVVFGKILDVAVDLRKNSPTFGKHFSIELSSDNKKQLFIPKGFAHGFSVLSETVIVNYKCDSFYNKDAESGIFFADKDINIDWHLAEKYISLSEKDRLLPLLKDSILNL